MQLKVDPLETRLVTSAGQMTRFPTALRGHAAPERYCYAVIGMNDDTMGDLIPAGSLVEVDLIERVVHATGGHTIRSRPIYLVWHAAGHTCSWCQLDGKELTLIPHPLSRRPVRHFQTPNEAWVVGRVVNAWLPLEPQQKKRCAESSGRTLSAPLVGRGLSNIRKC